MEHEFHALAAVEYAIGKAEADSQRLSADLHNAEVHHDRIAASRVSATLDLIERRLGRLRARQSSLIRTAA